MTKKYDCKNCGECGSVEIYDKQIRMPIGGRVRCIDPCIHDIVAALNAGSVPTIGCCCGHGKTNGSILLDDGRELIIKIKDKRVE